MTDPQLCDVLIGATQNGGRIARDSIGEEAVPVGLQAAHDSHGYRRSWRGRRYPAEVLVFSVCGRM
jgi:hypothetical protein